MPKLKFGHISPTTEEDAEIQNGIDADPDADSLSDEDWEKVKHTAIVGDSRRSFQESIVYKPAASDT